MRDGFGEVFPELPARLDAFADLSAQSGKGDDSDAPDLAVDGDFGPLTWGAVFDLFELRLAELLKGDLAGSLYYTADGETKRGAVNTWIRSNGVADGAFDFDELLRDTSDPTKYAASYDSGDHLHPNDAGYAVMAKAVDLEKLR